MPARQRQNSGTHINTSTDRPAPSRNRKIRRRARLTKSDLEQTCLPCCSRAVGGQWSQSGAARRQAVHACASTGGPISVGLPAKVAKGSYSRKRGLQSSCGLPTNREKFLVGKEIGFARKQVARICRHRRLKTQFASIPIDENVCPTPKHLDAGDRKPSLLLVSTC
jgi:hypothetical protein